MPIDRPALNIGENSKACYLLTLLAVQDGEPNEFEIPFDPACADDSAWRYPGRTTLPDRTTPLEQCTAIELHPTLCQHVKAGEIEGLSFAFGCKAGLL